MPNQIPVSLFDPANAIGNDGAMLVSRGPGNIPSFEPRISWDSSGGKLDLDAHLVRHYLNAITFVNDDPAVLDKTPFSIHHNHSEFALGNDPILVIGYNQGPGMIPDKPSITLTLEGDYFPSSNYRTMELNLDCYSNDFSTPNAHRLMAFSFNRINHVGGYSFAGGQGTFLSNDGLTTFMQFLEIDQPNGTVYTPQALYYVPIYSNEIIATETKFIIDNAEHIPITVVGAKTPNNELYSGFNITWNEANSRFENPTTTGSGGIFFAQDGTIKIFSALSQATGSEITSKFSYNPSGVLSVGGPYDGTSGVAIEGHGVVKSRTTAGSATVQAQGPNVTLMMLANEGAGWGVIGTQTNHPLMFYSNNTRRGFADTDGTLYWGTANGFKVAPSGAVTSPSFTPTTKPTITGSRTDGTALADLLTKLGTLGLITDSSIA